MGGAQSVVLADASRLESHGFVLDDTVASALRISSSHPPDEPTVDHVHVVVSFVKGMFPSVHEKKVVDSPQDGDVKTNYPASTAAAMTAALETKIRSMLEQELSPDLILNLEVLSLWSETLKKLLGVDPWYDVALSDQLDKLKQEELKFIDLDEGDNLGDTIEECDGPCAVVCNDGAVDLLKDPPIIQRTKILSVDLSNCTDIRVGPGFLNTTLTRHLSLSGCSFAEEIALDFRGLGCLISLDLSFCPYGWLWNSLDLTVLRNKLLVLDADSCELKQIPTCVATLTRLRKLSLQGNELEYDVRVCRRLEILGSNSGLSLLEIDFRENPITKQRLLYRECVLKYFPGLAVLDNKILSTANGGAVLQGEHLQHVRDALAGSNTVADQNEDRGSCSCLEGNPCAIEYACKDWKHRFAIAEAVMAAGK